MSNLLCPFTAAWTIETFSADDRQDLMAEILRYSSLLENSSQPVGAWTMIVRILQDLCDSRRTSCLDAQVKEDVHKFWNLLIEVSQSRMYFLTRRPNSKPWRVSVVTHKAYVLHWATLNCWLQLAVRLTQDHLFRCCVSLKKIGAAAFSNNFSVLITLERCKRLGDSCIMQKRATIRRPSLDCFLLVGLFG